MWRSVLRQQSATKFGFQLGGTPKIGKHPKMEALQMENPIFLMDDLGGGETHYFRKHPVVVSPTYRSSPKGTDQRRRTALHFAAHEGSIEVAL